MKSIRLSLIVYFVLLVGGVIGAQIGVQLTRHFSGPRIRFAFVPLPLLGAAVMIYKLVSGTGGG